MSGGRRSAPPRHLSVLSSQIRFDLLTTRAGDVEVLAGVAADIRLAAASLLDLIADRGQPRGQLGAIHSGGVLLGAIQLARWQRTHGAIGRLGHWRENRRRWYRPHRWGRWRDGPLNERGLPRRQVRIREVQPDDEVFQLQVAVQGWEPTDLTRHDQRLDLPLQAAAALILFARRPAFAESFDLDLANRVGDPLGGARLAGPEEDLRRRLRQHRLGVVAVPRLELAPSLEPQDNRIVRLPVLGHGRVELRQALEAGELVEDEPHRSVGLLTAGHQAQHEHVEPEAGQRHQPGARLRCAGQGDPSLPGARPGRGAPALCGR